MQKIQLDGYSCPLHCPFCGHETIAEEAISPCEHTLFIATDETLEYCSELIKKRTLIKKADELGWDEATDELKHDDAVKFALYMGGSGAYIGYAAPLVAESEGS